MDERTAYVLAQLALAAGALFGVVVALGKWVIPRLRGATSMFSELAGMPVVLKRMEGNLGRIEREGADTKALMRAMSDTHTDGMWEADADGLCIYTNETYLRWVGRALADTLGYGWINCIAQVDREHVRDEWDAAVEQRREFSLHYRMVTVGGVEFAVETVARVKRIDGKVCGWVGQVRKVVTPVALALPAPVRRFHEAIAGSSTDHE
jgi:PAS domain S-box-containing protein